MGGGIGIVLGAAMGVIAYRLTTGGPRERLGLACLAAGPVAGLMLGWSFGGK